MKAWLRISCMPTFVRLVFMFGFLFPVFSVTSVLTGSLLPHVRDLQVYGDAGSLFELSSVFIVSSITVVPSVLIFLRKMVVVYFMPPIYILASFSPLLLPVVRDHIMIAMEGLIVVPFVVILASIYIYNSKVSSYYFLDDSS